MCQTTKPKNHKVLKEKTQNPTFTDKLPKSSKGQTAGHTAQKVCLVLLLSFSEGRNTLKVKKNYTKLKKDDI